MRTARGSSATHEGKTGTCDKIELMFRLFFHQRRPNERSPDSINRLDVGEEMGRRRE